MYVYVCVKGVVVENSDDASIATQNFTAPSIKGQPCTELGHVPEGHKACLSEARLWEE